MRKDIFLKVSISVTTIFGMYPMNVSEESKIANILYKIYRRSGFAYLLSFILGEYLELYFMNKDNVLDIFDNLGVNLLYVVTFMKIVTVSSGGIVKIIKRVRELEVFVYSGGNRRIIEIYETYAKRNNKLSTSIMTLGFITIIPFYFIPMFKNVEILIDGNLTTHRSLPFVAWYPFDKYKYYKLTYFLQILVTSYTTAGIVCMDAIIWAMILFAICFMKILQDKLRFFRNNPQNTYLLSIKDCVRLHQLIIDFVYDFNAAINLLTLFDFLACSVQMGISIIRIVMTGSFGIPEIFAAEFFLSMVIQLFLFYGLANELSIESLRISDAVWESDWSDLPNDIKKMLFFISFNAKKPLALTIGPFYPMSLGTALRILKTAYSCVTLLQQSYGRNA